MKIGLIVFVVILIILAIRGVFLEKRRRLVLISELKKSFGLDNKKNYPYGKKHRKAILNKNIAEADIDDITWSDLDMESVFEKVDSTRSAVGEEYLYYVLHRTQNLHEAMEISQIADYYTANENDRDGMLLSLSRIGYVKEFSPFDYLDYLTSKDKKFPALDIILDFLFIPFIALIFIKPLLGLGLVFCLVIFNIYKYFKDKKEIDGIISTVSFLVRITREVSLINNLPDCFMDEDKALVINNKKLFRTIYKRGNYLAVSGKNNTGATASSSPIEILLNYMNMLFHIDLIQYKFLLRDLFGKEDVLSKVLLLFGKIDASISVASYRQSLKGRWCKPKFVYGEDNSLVISDFYHPLIKEPVVNSVNTKKSILLTGSNASGKSTFLRSVAINAILSQSIFTALATDYSSPECQIYSSIALKDNLSNNESYFIVEIKSLKRILDASGKDKPVLCFVDEVLRGTNTTERISASKVILESLSDSGAICFAATHDGELADILSEKFSNYHFSEVIENNDISFDYKLREGKATSRNALALLKMYGYPENITIEAEKLAQKLDTF